MHKRERYYINAHGPNEAAVSKAIQKAVALSKRLPGVERIVLLTNGLNNTQWLEKEFGYDAIRKLKEGAKLANTSVIGKFDSIKSYDSKSYDIVVSFVLESEELLELDDRFDISAIVAVPWTNDGIEKWVKITNATHLDSNLPADSYDLPPCEVQQALQDLSDSINLSTGLTHPSDGDLAKTYLRALNKYGYRLNNLEVESFLIKNMNWDKRITNELVSIVDKLNNGKSFHGGNKTNLKYHIDRWKAACK